MYKVTLNDGVRMPVIGYGTYFQFVVDNGSVEQVTEEGYQKVKGYLKSALEAGFIHLDTAEMYLAVRRYYRQGIEGIECGSKFNIYYDKSMETQSRAISYRINDSICKQFIAIFTNRFH
eukprot:330210_1